MRRAAFACAALLAVAVLIISSVALSAQPSPQATARQRSTT